MAPGENESRLPRHRRPDRARRHVSQRPPSRSQSRFILANPPFNISDWGGERLRDDKRWQFGKPPVGNANFAWVQHIIHHLAPTGIAGFVLANGSMSSNQSGEGEIRKNIIEADLVDCMIALPGQLFYSTQIPACLWFLLATRKTIDFRDRRGQALFIDARKLGIMADRTHRELTDEEIGRIAQNVSRLARRDKTRAKYEDVPGFCKAPPSMKSASTATFSPPAATSAPRRRKTTASRSKRR